jgi:hypothetical protein
MVRRGSHRAQSLLARDLGALEEPGDRFGLGCPPNERAA